MTLIDQIRKDREAGTPGPWQADSLVMPDGHSVRIAFPAHTGVPDATMA